MTVTERKTAIGDSGPDSGDMVAGGKSADLKISSQVQWNKANPKARWAQRCLRSALKAGLIEKRPCEVCGSEDSEAHHPDYDKPAVVTWLCRLHHKHEHKRMREGK